MQAARRSAHWCAYLAVGHLCCNLRFQMVILPVGTTREDANALRKNTQIVLTLHYGLHFCIKIFLGGTMQYLAVQGASRVSQTFSHEHLVKLLQQMTGHLRVKMEHSPAMWASTIMAATDGLKGLAGAVLREVNTVLLPHCLSDIDSILVVPLVCCHMHALHLPKDSALIS